MHEIGETIESARKHIVKNAKQHVVFGIGLFVVGIMQEQPWLLVVAVLYLLVCILVFFKYSKKSEKIIMIDSFAIRPSADELAAKSGEMVSIDGTGNIGRVAAKMLDHVRKNRSKFNDPKGFAFYGHGVIFDSPYMYLIDRDHLLNISGKMESGEFRHEVNSIRSVNISRVYDEWFLIIKINDLQNSLVQMKLTKNTGKKTLLSMQKISSVFEAGLNTCAPIEFESGNGLTGRRKTII